MADRLPAFWVGSHSRTHSVGELLLYPAPSGTLKLFLVLPSSKVTPYHTSQAQYSYRIPHIQRTEPTGETVLLRLSKSQHIPSAIYHRVGRHIYCGNRHVRLHGAVKESWSSQTNPMNLNTSNNLKRFDRVVMVTAI